MNPVSASLLEPGNDSHLKRIADYLTLRAMDDSALDEKIAKSGKTIGDCFSYIKDKARSLAESGFYCAEDDEVFGWATHYYDELGDPKDIKVRATYKPIQKPVEQAEEKAYAVVQAKSSRKAAKKKVDDHENEISLFDF